MRFRRPGLLAGAVALTMLAAASVHAATVQLQVQKTTSCANSTPSVVNGFVMLQADANGVCVSLTGAGSGGTSSNFAAAFPSAGTAAGFKDSSSGNMVAGNIDNSSGGVKVDVVAGGAGGGAVYGPTATGTAAANPPVVMGGTVDGTAIGAVETWKVDASHFGHVVLESTLPAFAATPTVNLGTLNGVALDTSVGTTNTDVGAPGATVCATDTGSCSLNAQLQRLAQRLTTLITAVGSPFQAAASIGNTAFTANAGTNLNTSALALDTSVGTTNTDVGAPGATVCATDTGSCSLNAQIQRLLQRITTLNTTLGSPFQAAASIGNTTFASTQSGPWADAATSATGSAVPAKAGYAGAISSGSLVGIVQADSSAAISVSTATTTQLVALSSGKVIDVSAFSIVVAGADNVTLEYGTGTACATGTTTLTGAMNFAANGGISQGSGLGVLYKVPASNALCMVTSAAVQASGAVSYTQF